MTIDISQFYQVFFDEAEELLAEMERLLLAVDVAAPDPEDLNAIFRTAHSVKGGASTFGLSDMSEVTHVLESLLDRIRKGEMALTSNHVDAFLAAKDSLKMQLDGHRHGAAVDREDGEDDGQADAAVGRLTDPDEDPCQHQLLVVGRDRGSGRGQAPDDGHEDERLDPAPAVAEQ